MPRGLEPSTLLWAVGWMYLLGDIPEEADPVGIATRAADALEARAPRTPTSPALSTPWALPLPYPTPPGSAQSGSLARPDSFTRNLQGSRNRPPQGVRSPFEAASTHCANLNRRSKRAPPGRSLPTMSIASFEEAGMAESVTGAVQEASPELQQQQRSHALRKLGNDFRDGVVGPLLYFAIFGIPGAVAYRVVKTLAARWRRQVTIRWPSPPSESTPPPR